MPDDGPGPLPPTDRPATVPGLREADLVGAPSEPFTVGPTTVVRTAPELAAAAATWKREAEDAGGLALGWDVVGPVAQPPTDGASSRWEAEPALLRGTVTFELDDDLEPGAYGLRTRTERVTVRAADVAGAHAAAQTLRQLAGPAAFRRAPVGDSPLTVPGGLYAHDGPAHAWRGVLLDVARHFLPKHDVLRFVELAAAHHLNVVQLHLTDDQGWRFESRWHPRLTEVGSWRRESNVGTWRAGVLDGRPHGGFYTQDDLREIVAHARAHGVTVVPELDVPGHVEAAVAAYPELGTRKRPHEVRTTWGISTEVLDPSEETLGFFRDVLDEVMDVFDSPYVALGGDEVPTALWRANPDIVRRAADLGLDDVADLHGWFLGSLARHVVDAGRRPVVWDEAFRPGDDTLPRETVVTAWRGWTVGLRAMAAGHDVVMAPEQAVYLDHRAGDGPDEPVPVGFLHTLRDVHRFEPLPAGALAEAGVADVGTLPGKLLGAQAELWAEHLDSARRLDYAAYPRLAAFADVVWRDEPLDQRDTDAFLTVLERDHLPRLTAFGVEFRPLDGPHPWQTRPGVAGHPRDLAAELASGGFAGLGGWVEDGSGTRTNEVGG
ncbi:beta-N-acetylhexosaminidase [Luteimicrobium sp. DT211]|uniref:beta-N-acetylhexosaminidase n=1 Tax=Luteimicrobium sp. DT211 TaxID=3393412 RepID=UPI003CF64FB0